MWHILKNKEIIKVEENEWQEWYIRNIHDLVIARDKIRGTTISTVFAGIPLTIQLGKDSAFFQTKVFGGALDGKSEVFTSYDSALEGHIRICGEVIDAL
jgi:hypothetical protein